MFGGLHRVVPVDLAQLAGDARVAPLLRRLVGGRKIRNREAGLDVLQRDTVRVDALVGAGAGLGVAQPALDNVAVTLGSSSYLSLEGNVTTTLGPTVTVTQAAGTGGHIFPGLAIAFLVLGFNFLGDGLRDALDPATRRAAPSGPPQ